MIAKTLRNPARRTKFKVGATVKLPTSVWQHFVSPMRMAYPKLPQVNGVVKEVSDRIITNKKPNGNGVNRHCRFAVVLNSPQIGEAVVWEEWMLEKIEVVDNAQQIKIETIASANPCPTAGGSLPGQ